MIRIDDALQQTIRQLRTTQSATGGRLRAWTGTVAGPRGVSVRYDCRAVTVEQARLLIADQAGRSPGEVRDLALTCGVFAVVEAGDPR